MRAIANRVLSNEDANHNRELLAAPPCTTYNVEIARWGELLQEFVHALVGARPSAR